MFKLPCEPFIYNLFFLNTAVWTNYFIKSNAYTEKYALTTTNIIAMNSLTS